MLLRGIDHSLAIPNDEGQKTGTQVLNINFLAEENALLWIPPAKKFDDFFHDLLGMSVLVDIQERFW